ncbi:MAG: polysaccharide deacetylase family protein [Terriglobia bacterium]
MTRISQGTDGVDHPWDSEPIATQRIVTTSWDDGVAHDTRIASLLKERSLPGTFYVPIIGRFSSLAMSPTDLCSLAAQGFEVGAHGYSHVSLSECDADEISREVTLCRMELEQLLGTEVRMFAYPQGRYNRKALRAVRKAGYIGARTTRMFSLRTEFDCYRMPTTIQVYQHSNVDYLRNLTRAIDFGQIWNYLTKLRHVSKWTDLAKGLFDHVMDRGGIWHLYGHSWEIQELNLWDDLADVLDYVARRQGVRYLSNCQVVDSLHPPKVAALAGMALPNP